jgi:hypothetical protein
MRLRKAESAASVPLPPAAAVEGSGLWFDGVGGGGPGNTLPAEDVPGADATAAPVEEDEEEDAMERRRLAGAAEGFFWWETGGGLLGGVREQAILFGSIYGPHC